MYTYKEKYTIKIALISVFGALSLTISFLTSGIPYPIAPFLKIDFSEIIDLLAYFIGGEYVGILTATLHFLGLVVNAQFIIGPPLKYIAVLSMMIGFSISKRIIKNLNFLETYGIIYSTIISSIFRALIMVAVNIIIILLIAPEFYQFFEYQLSLLGYVNITLFDVIMYTTFVIGSYNIIQTVFAVIVAYTIFKTSNKYFTNL